MTVWLFSSSSLESIRVGYERPLWGFWRRDACPRERWGPFLSAYQRVKPSDIAVIQLTEDYGIYAVGVVRERYYDDLTLVWRDELRRREVPYSPERPLPNAPQR